MPYRLVFIVKRVGFAFDFFKQAQRAGVSWSSWKAVFFAIMVTRYDVINGRGKGAASLRPAHH